MFLPQKLDKYGNDHGNHPAVFCCGKPILGLVLDELLDSCRCCDGDADVHMSHAVCLAIAYLLFKKESYGSLWIYGL